MKIHVIPTVCDVCGGEGMATFDAAASQWIVGGFISHRDPRVCAEVLKQKAKAVARPQTEQAP